jgi:hypothetical protein
VPLVWESTGYGTEQVTSHIAAYGIGTGVPFTGGTNDTLVQPVQGPTFPNCQVRCHRVGITLCCLGSSTSGVLLPTTFARFGTIRGKVEPRLLTNWTGYNQYMAGQSSLHTRTGYSLMTQPVHVVAHPLDIITWSELRPNSQNTAGDVMVVSDALSPICIVLSNSTSADNYQITVHVEWDLLVSSSGSAGSLVNSAATLKPALQDGLIHQVSAAAMSVAGHVESIAEAGLAVVGARAAMAARAGRAVEAMVPRALPALLPP